MTDYRIAPAGPEHIDQLAAIETAAARLFSVADLPPPLRGHSTPLRRLEQAQQARRLWVALDVQCERPVGFALVTMPGRHAHLQELDVHPQHGRQGLGTKLVQAVLAWARQQGHSCVTLTTFRHIRWNAPFYAKLGFEILDDEQLDADPVLRQLVEIEIRDGLSNRVAMRCEW